MWKFHGLRKGKEKVQIKLKRSLIHLKTEKNTKSVASLAVAHNLKNIPETEWRDPLSIPEGKPKDIVQPIILKGTKPKQARKRTN